MQQQLAQAKKALKTKKELEKEHADKVKQIKQSSKSEQDKARILKDVDDEFHKMVAESEKYVDQRMGMQD